MTMRASYFKMALLAALLPAGAGRVSAQNDSELKSSSTRVIEEKTVTETRKVYEEAPRPSGLRKVAIIVENRAGKDFEDKTVVLEDLLASRLAGRGFTIVSRDVVINSLRQDRAKDEAAAPPGAKVKKSVVEVERESSSQGGAQNRFNDRQRTTVTEIKGGDSESPGQKLTRALNDSTTALRLAQDLGVEFILLPTITSYGEDRRNYQGNGLATKNVIHILRVGYRMAEAGQGGMIAGNTLAVNRTTRQSASSQEENTDIINQLLDEAADKLAEDLVKKQVTLAAPEAKAGLVNVTINTTVADFGKLPNVALNQKNEVVLDGESGWLTAMDVTVEMNGLTIGSAPGTFKVPAGINKIRLTREGFTTYEKTINTYEGQKLTVAMQMDKAGYARWKDAVSFMTGLERNRKMTDAEVEVLKGQAQMLRQSGFRVDSRVRVNTTEGIKYNLFRNLY